MPLNPISPGVHHIGLRCLDFSMTKRFYENIIGFRLALETPDLIAFVIGAVIIVFKQAKPPHPEDKTFTPFNIGLDHIALTLESESELQRLAEGLKSANVENTGVKTDPVLQKQYVAFKDPDRIQWEFYMK
jgi:catechol 2,3-dioxygenase-like lactoylglutathione lyase family enzyme